MAPEASHCRLTVVEMLRGLFEAAKWSQYWYTGTLALELGGLWVLI